MAHPQVSKPSQFLDHPPVLLPLEDHDPASRDVIIGIGSSMTNQEPAQNSDPLKNPMKLHMRKNLRQEVESLSNIIHQLF